MKMIRTAAAAMLLAGLGTAGIARAAPAKTPAKSASAKPAMKTTPKPAATIVSESTRARAARRAYDGAPPTIPHDPVEVACTTCHGEEAMEAGVGVAPAFPHAKTPGLSDESRCTQCHVYRNTDTTFRASAFAGDPQDVNRRGERKTKKAAPFRPHRAFMREDCRVCHLGPGARPELVPKHGPRPRCEVCHPTREPD